MSFTCSPVDPDHPQLSSYVLAEDGRPVGEIDWQDDAHRLVMLLNQSTWEVGDVNVRVEAPSEDWPVVPASSHPVRYWPVRRLVSCACGWRSPCEDAVAGYRLHQQHLDAEGEGA
jgi:hypothetical protein